MHGAYKYNVKTDLRLWISIVFNVRFYKYSFLTGPSYQHSVLTFVITYHFVLDILIGVSNHKCLLTERSVAQNLVHDEYMLLPTSSQNKQP
jgi:hypothetical protein